MPPTRLGTPRAMLALLVLVCFFASSEGLPIVSLTQVPALHTVRRSVACGKPRLFDLAWERIDMHHGGMSTRRSRRAHLGTRKVLWPLVSKKKTEQRRSVERRHQC
ncbi:hypothetical protein CALVIDRAFT_539022 [Calocera viscosa TUFC12733]|uniref:Secreted protein n=1 Tax=Calocera viscosa (strain TUFC12733) TaxID=1330018 RepID=A0A167KET7_CALVF|nr:hypothetical protein CALVIDRAFT_539022 [Calocera viscosa TUFC12733]